MKIRLRVEELRPSAIPAWMINDHFQENAKHKDVFTRPDPDWHQYLEAQKKGELIFVAARDDQVLNLVGYIAMFLRPHPHYKVLVAVDDLHYLMPAYRGEGNGKAMLCYAEEAAAKAGARIFCMRCKAEQDHGHIFRGMGYALTDLVYTKDLRHAPPPSA